MDRLAGHGGALNPRAIAKSFAPASIPLGGTSVLTFTITTPNPAATLTAVEFSDDRQGDVDLLVELSSCEDGKELICVS